jgi:hypothetical protein
MQHEQGSIDLFDHMVESNDLKKKFKKYFIEELDITFIKELINGPRVCFLGTSGNI